MGFSPIGLLISGGVLAPNLLLLWAPPRPALPKIRVPWPVTWLERAGQALCLAVPAITSPGALSWGWSIPTLGCLAAYLALWLRYLVTGRRLDALYAGPGKLRVPMAILPVLVFLGAAAWLGNPWVAASALVLGAGHLPASVLTARAVLRERV